ncbi:DNA polymerase [bacterium]|jgi:DNA polymerase-1|nr:DNA polymerase [bacterium]MDB4350093.1 DNA polymerase [bacterium]
MEYIWDLEADNLLDEVTQVWCHVFRDVDTDEVHTFDPTQTQEALDFMDKAKTLIGHNITDYDLRVIKKLHGYTYKGKVIDTLVYSRTVWPDVKEIDFKLNKRGNFPQKLIGSHSLKAWGYRLGELKGDFNSGSESFAAYTPEMLDYCIQDTAVTNKLYRKIMEKNFSQLALDLEAEIHTLLLQQQEHGFDFNVQEAQALYSRLAQRRSDIEDELVSTFEPTIIELKTKTKTIPFNPASRMQIADRLMKRGWKPKAFTDSGEPKVDETVLSGIDMPEAKLLNEYLLLNKRIGQLATGKQAWLKMEKGGKIHGRVNHMGAVTSRCTHSNPNTAQIPSVGAPYGKECRELFISPSGYSLLGADASGLELRCLAHYMAAYDDGSYADVVLNGDIHTANQMAAGLESRNQAKTFIYGFLYGSGDEKTGKIIGKGAKEGKAIKQKFLKKLPALKYLKDAVSKAADERGWVKGLDGRIIPIRHSHAALNTLLQSAGAIICKTWYVFISRAIKKAKLDAQIVAFIHDEVQVVVKKGQEDETGRVILECMRDVERHFNFRCRLDSEYKYGSNWADTH